MSGTCGPCAARSIQQRRFVAIDPLTGDCLVPDTSGGCKRFRTATAAKAAAVAAGYEGEPGTRRV